MNWRPNALNARRAPTAEVLNRAELLHDGFIFRHCERALHIKATRERSPSRHPSIPTWAVKIAIQTRLAMRGWERGCSFNLPVLL